MPTHRLERTERQVRIDLAAMAASGGRVNIVIEWPALLRGLDRTDPSYQH